MPIHSKIDLFRYNTKFSKKLLDRLDNKECDDFRLFVHSVQQRNYENLEYPILKLETGFASRSMTYPSGRVISHSSHKRFSKLLQTRKPRTDTMKDEQHEIIRGNFYQTKLIEVK